MPLLLFVTALMLCWPRLKPLPDTTFITPTQPPLATISPSSTNLQAELLPRAGVSAHAVTLVESHDGKLIAAWFGGSREGAADVAIYSSQYDSGKGAWSAPHRIVERQQLTRDTQRLIRKLGNPVLWHAPDNVLHLWFVSVSYGGWAGSAINHMQSSDDGQQWSKATRIVSSPFWNLSTLVRNPPLALTDGAIVLPVYHELLNKRPEWLRINHDGQLLDKVRIPHSAGTLQPAAVALDAQHALVLMRNSRGSHRIQMARSNNAGRDWQPSTALPIPNPDSAIALIRLADGSLLLACNPLEANRHQLALLRSTDEGKRWSAPYIVEQGEINDEFSYPALLQDSKGSVHLAYTWKRQAIKHVAVPNAMLAELK